MEYLYNILILFWVRFVDSYFWLRPGPKSSSKLPADDLKGDWSYKQNAKLRSSAICWQRGLRPDREEVHLALSGMRTVYLSPRDLIKWEVDAEEEEKDASNAFAASCSHVAGDAAVPSNMQVE